MSQSLKVPSCGAVRVSGNVYLALKGGQSPLLRVISCRALRQPRLKFHAVIQGHAQIEQISGASILLLVIGS